MALSMDMSFLAKYDKVIVELGCGDGELLFGLANQAENWNNFYLGIEIDPSQYKKSCLLLSKSKYNLLFVNCPFEQVINELPDCAADEILCVLPHPKYIDRENEKFWQSLYETLLHKLKKSGHLLLITEYTDELFSPVLYIEYLNWKEWIVKTFTDLGFCINQIIEGVAPEYTSRYIDLFRNDQERIKILTLDLTKNRY